MQGQLQGCALLSGKIRSLAMNYKEGRNDRVNENSMINPFRLSSPWDERWSIISLAYMLAETQTNMPRWAQAHGPERAMTAFTQRTGTAQGMEQESFLSTFTTFWGRIIALWEAFGRNLTCCWTPSLCKYLGKKAFPFGYLGGVWGSGWAERRDDPTINSEKHPN